MQSPIEQTKDGNGKETARKRYGILLKEYILKLQTDYSKEEGIKFLSQWQDVHISDQGLDFIFFIRKELNALYPDFQKAIEMKDYSGSLLLTAGSLALTQLKNKLAKTTGAVGLTSALIYMYSQGKKDIQIERGAQAFLGIISSLELMSKWVDDVAIALHYRFHWFSEQLAPGEKGVNVLADFITKNISTWLLENDKKFTDEPHLLGDVLKNCVPKKGNSCYDNYEIEGSKPKSIFEKFALKISGPKKISLKIGNEFIDVKLQDLLWNGTAITPCGNIYIFEKNESLFQYPCQLFYSELFPKSQEKTWSIYLDVKTKWGEFYHKLDIESHEKHCEQEKENNFLATKSGKIVKYFPNYLEFELIADKEYREMNKLINEIKEQQLKINENLKKIEKNNIWKPFNLHERKNLFWKKNTQNNKTEKDNTLVGKVTKLSKLWVEKILNQNIKNSISLGHPKIICVLVELKKTMDLFYDVKIMFENEIKRLTNDKNVTEIKNLSDLLESINKIHDELSDNLGKFKQTYAKDFVPLLKMEEAIIKMKDQEKAEIKKAEIQDCIGSGNPHDFLDQSRESQPSALPNPFNNLLPWYALNPLHIYRHLGRLFEASKKILPNWLTKVLNAEIYGYKVVPCLLIAGGICYLIYSGAQIKLIQITWENVAIGVVCYLGLSYSSYKDMIFSYNEKLKKYQNNVKINLSQLVISNESANIEIIQLQEKINQINEGSHPYDQKIDLLTSKIPIDSRPEKIFISDKENKIIFIDPRGKKIENCKAFLDGNFLFFNFSFEEFKKVVNVLESKGEKLKNINEKLLNKIQMIKDDQLAYKKIWCSTGEIKLISETLIGNIQNDLIEKLLLNKQFDALKVENVDSMWYISMDFKVFDLIFEKCKDLPHHSKLGENVPERFYEPQLRNDQFQNAKPIVKFDLNNFLPIECVTHAIMKSIKNFQKVDVDTAPVYHSHFMGWINGIFLPTNVLEMESFQSIKNSTIKINKLFEKINSLKLHETFLVPMIFDENNGKQGEHFALFGFRKMDEKTIKLIFVDSFGDTKGFGSLLKNQFLVYFEQYKKNFKESCHFGFTIEVYCENYQHNNDCSVHTWQNAIIIAELDSQNFNSGAIKQKIETRQLKDSEHVTKLRLQMARNLENDEEFLNSHSGVKIDQSLLLIEKIDKEDVVLDMESKEDGKMEIFDNTPNISLKKPENKEELSSMYNSKENLKNNDLRENRNYYFLIIQEYLEKSEVIDSKVFELLKSAMEDAKNNEGLLFKQIAKGQGLKGRQLIQCYLEKYANNHKNELPMAFFKAAEHIKNYINNKAPIKANEKKENEEDSSEEFFSSPIRSGNDRNRNQTSQNLLPKNQKIDEKEIIFN